MRHNLIVIRIMGNAMKTTTMRGKCLLIIGWMLWLGSCGSEEPRSRLQRLQAELTALRQQSTMDPEREAAIRLAMARAYVGAVERDSAGIDPAAYLFQAAEVYEDLAQEETQALRLYRWLAQDYADHPLGAEALFRQGWMYANLLQDTTQAQQTLAEFVQRYPNHELVPNVPTELVQLGMSPDRAHQFLQKSLAPDSLAADSNARAEPVSP
jgi:hypothetical protein